MTFSRYAGPGSHRYPIGFSGDTHITWESLDFQPYFTTTATICGSMILGAFTTGEVRRRLTASPRRMALMGLQRLLTLGGFALVVCVGYLALSIGLMMAAGLDPLHLSVGGC